MRLRDQLRGAIKAISEYGGGVVVYLAQEGRDIGLVNKLRAYNLQDLGSDTVEANHQIGFEVDERIYAPAAEILKQLGIKKVKLLTNNPNKIDQLASTGIEVVERVKHAFPPNPHNREYLKTKAAKTVIFLVSLKFTLIFCIAQPLILKLVIWRLL